MSRHVALVALALGACSTPQPLSQNLAPETAATSETAVQTLVAEGLAHPWDMMFLSASEAVVTEKDGTIRHVRLDTGEISAVAGVPADLDNIRRNDPRDNSGLFAIVADPDFGENRMIYVAYSAGDETGTALKVIRARWSEAKALEDVQPIFEVAPLSTDRFHYGGGLVFAADGTLLITAGERIFNEQDQPDVPVAQDLFDMRGKIFRINTDGSIPADNPDMGEGAVPGLYALGIRASQGLTRHPETGTIWFSEHGSIQGDEINVLKPGSNYGWPIVTDGTYRDTAYTPPYMTASFTAPVWSWSTTVAPTGLTFYSGAQFPDWTGDLLVAGLSRGSLWRLDVEGETVVSASHLFASTPARLRNVRQGPDGALYLLTDEANGRILRIDPA